MPTLKTRINLSVPRETELFLASLAKRDGVPVATKALELIDGALDLEEDAHWLEKLKERSKPVPFLSHKQAKNAFAKVIARNVRD